MWVVVEIPHVEGFDAAFVVRFTSLELSRRIIHFEWLRRQVLPGTKCVPLHMVQCLKYFVWNRTVSRDIAAEAFAALYEGRLQVLTLNGQWVFVNPWHTAVLEKLVPGTHATLFFDEGEGEKRLPLTI